MKDSIFNTIVFSTQLFICMYETVRTSKCEKLEQKITEMEGKKCSTACWPMCVSYMSEGETSYYNNNFSKVQRITNNHVNNNNMLLSDENRTKCFH